MFTNNFHRHISHSQTFLPKIITMPTKEFGFNFVPKCLSKQTHTVSPYLEKQDLNTVNLEGTNPLQFAVLSNLKQVSYKNQLQVQDVVPPKSTEHKIRARSL